MKGLTLEQAKQEYSKGYKETINQWDDESLFQLNRLDFEEEYKTCFAEYEGFSENDFLEFLRGLDSRIEIV